MVPVSEKKQLLDDLRRALDDNTPGSVSVLVRKALMLAALCNDSTHEMLFELHLLGIDMWVKSGNKEVWQRRGVDDNDYVAKANAADRKMQNDNVDTRPLADLESWSRLRCSMRNYLRTPTFMTFRTWRTKCVRPWPTELRRSKSSIE
jgi:hypothetical protein